MPAKPYVSLSSSGSPPTRLANLGRSAELEAFSIGMFHGRDVADAAAMAMNAEPLVAGQVSETPPTPM